MLDASLGDVDEAFRWLEIAIRERSSGMTLLRVHPRLDPIRKDRDIASSFIASVSRARSFRPTGAPAE